MNPNLTLYIALAFYGAGTLVALLSLFAREKRLQHAGLALMVIGFLTHTVWIGTICTLTGHPPITNLPETASFIAWLVFLVELVLFVVYRVHAASFFVYPLVLILLSVSAVVHEPFAHSPKLLSRLFTAHLLLTTAGVAALLIGLAFGLLAHLQDRALKSKTRGRLWDLIPSLNVCKDVSYRALAIGFSIYTLGLITGVLWSYRTTAGIVAMRTKEVGAIVAWMLFAVVLQSYISGTYRTRRTMLVGAGAFIAILVAMLGIHHV
jgi:ABC-type uncharacterized transport system permease subunit